MSIAAGKTFERNHRLGKDAQGAPNARGVRVAFLHVRADANHHVTAWEAWQRLQHPAVRPPEFVKLYCKVHNVELEILYRRRGRGKILEFRKKLIFALLARYPNLTSPQIGKVLQRDHTTILYLMGRTKSSQRTGKGKE